MIALIVLVTCKETVYGGKSITEQSYLSYDQDPKVSKRGYGPTFPFKDTRLYCFTVQALPDNIKL